MEQHDPQSPSNNPRTHKEATGSQCQINTRESQTSNDDGSQRVWGHTFDHIIERAEVYLQSALDSLRHVSRGLGSKECQEGTVENLMSIHESLIEERDTLICLCHDTQQEHLPYELVEQADSYKSKVKALYRNVQQALEEYGMTYSPAVDASPFSDYKFPEPSVEEPSTVRHEELLYDHNAEQDRFAYAYCALGLYDLEPPSQRFGGTSSRTQDEPTELALSLLSRFDISRDLPMLSDSDYVEPLELQATLWHVSRSENSGRADEEYR